MENRKPLRDQFDELWQKALADRRERKKNYLFTHVDQMGYDMNVFDQFMANKKRKSLLINV
jgi:cephalosporin-C deacetylase-like acetyl esterase